LRFRKVSAPDTAEEARGEAELTPAERLRVKMWQARGTHSRYTGVVMLGISGVLLALAFLTAYSPFELVAIVSFVMGVFLISAELEPRVKLIPSVESLMGPLVALSEDLVLRGFDGKAIYAPKEGAVVMQFLQTKPAEEILSLVPVGRGLVLSLERELGPLGKAEFSYLKTWVPKALEKGLGLTEAAKITAEEGRVEVDFLRPYVRPLCVNKDFNNKVCSKFGCPLVSSMGELLALSNGKEVRYFGCHYENRMETASATFRIGD